MKGFDEMTSKSPLPLGYYQPLTDPGKEKKKDRCFRCSMNRCLEMCKTDIIKLSIFKRFVPFDLFIIPE